MVELYPPLTFPSPVNLVPFINGNIFSTPAIRIEIDQSLKRLETNAACFEETLAHQRTAISQITPILKQYEAAYAKTRSEQHRDRVQEVMDRHRYALSSPIRFLPDDFLAVILGLPISMRLSWAHFLGLQPGCADSGGPSHYPTTFFELPSVYSQTVISLDLIFRW